MVSAEQVAAMGRRAFGVDVVAFVELGGGLYNNTYRVDIGAERPVILRVAPEREIRIEHRLMRNEYASLPFFSPLAELMPRMLFADWTHDIIERDYVWQTMLDGVAGSEGLKAYPRSEWGAFYRQVGAIAKRIHAINGERFGMVAGPLFTTWSDAVLTSLHDTAADIDDAGLNSRDMREMICIVERDTAVLDEITQPRLLHGDLWLPNVMFAVGAPEPTVTGIFDHDRAFWGDPAADWPIYVVSQRAERDPFWETYGPPDNSPQAVWRALVYQARHIGAIRLERHRLGRDDRIEATYEDMRGVLDKIAQG